MATETAEATEGSAAPAAAEAGDVFAEAEKIVKEMEDLEDYYFAKDKYSKMARLSDSVSHAVDSAQSEAAGDLRLRGSDRKLRVRGAYLRGRATSLVPGQEPAAEALLSKAIKLDPQCLDAWNVLGEVYWNQQSYVQAQDCFEQALQLCGPNSVLRAIEVARDTEEGASQRAKNFAVALEKAKEAVALDTNDPENWETLGNAYVGDFFVNARRPDEINRALIAYAKADAIYEKRGKRNPTLQLNRGMAAKYIEDYNLALSSFRKAHEIGASGAAEQGQNVHDLVQRLATCVERKADLKVKRLKELMSDFPKGRSFAELRSGENSVTPLVARVVTVIDRKDEVPVIVVCCDGTGDFFALSIYNAELVKVAETLVPMKSVIRVQNPKFRLISLSCPDGKEISYPCARVTHPSEVLMVGGTTLGAVAAAAAVVSAGAARVVADAPSRDSSKAEASRPKVLNDADASNGKKKSEPGSAAAPPAGEAPESQDRKGAGTREEAGAGSGSGAKAAAKPLQAEESCEKNGSGDKVLVETQKGLNGTLDPSCLQNGSDKGKSAPAEKQAEADAGAQNGSSHAKPKGSGKGSRSKRKT